MWEYVIGYGPLGQDDAARFVIEERGWPSREAMLEDVRAEGWECVAIEPHRQQAQRFVFRRAVGHRADAPRHLLPCW